MNKTLCSVLLASSLSLVTSVSHADNALDLENFSANIAITSNYLFRGITISDDHPAVSGGFDWSYNGFYVGTWASSIDAVETESLEIDYYAGYTGTVNNFSYSLDAIYYDYPGEAKTGEPSNIGDLSYWEFGGSLAYSFPTVLSPTLGISIMHSPEYYAETGEATAVESLLEISPSEDITVSLHAGKQYLDDHYNSIDGYRYYGIDVSKTIGKFAITLGYSDTDRDGEVYQGSATDEVYLSLSASI